MAFNSNLIGQVEQALTRVLRAGPGIRDTHDSANAIIDVLRKLRIARELSDRYYIAVTGSQSAGKTRLMRELYNLGKDWLFDDQGRGERVPVFIIEDDSIDAPYGAVQSVENGEVVEKRLEAKDFRDLTTSWSETSCDLLPKLYVPRKFFSGSNVGFVLLPGYEIENQHNSAWQQLMRRTLNLSLGTILVTDPVRLAESSQTVSFLKREGFYGYSGGFARTVALINGIVSAVDLLAHGERFLARFRNGCLRIGPEASIAPFASNRTGKAQRPFATGFGWRQQ